MIKTNKLITENNWTNIFVIIGIIFILILSIVALTRISASEKEVIYMGDTERDTISFSASYTKSATPDELNVAFSIETLGDTPDQAYSQANEILKTIKDELGRKDYELETTGYYLYEDKRYNSVTGEYVTNGYKLTHSLNLKTKELDDSGDIVQMITDAGVSRINGVRFQLSDDLQEQIYNEALNEAIKKAKSKASATADSLGVVLSDIVSFNEGYNSPTYYKSYAEGLMYATEVAEELPVGDVDVTATVTIGYLVG